MALFIDLWPCLFTTKLSYAQLFKWGHSTLFVTPFENEKRWLGKIPAKCKLNFLEDPLGSVISNLDTSFLIVFANWLFSIKPTILLSLRFWDINTNFKWYVFTFWLWCRIIFFSVLYAWHWYWLSSLQRYFSLTNWKIFLRFKVPKKKGTQL